MKIAVVTERRIPSILFVLALAAWPCLRAAQTLFFDELGRFGRW